MMKITPVSLLFLSIAFAAPLANAGESNNENNAASGKEAVAYLEIYKEFSGKCMGLRRGDMRLLRNTHPDKTIEFRMIRLLDGQRQASIIRDTIAPGSEGQKLGCELLDDREQTYEITRARFVEESKVPSTTEATSETVQ